MITSVGDAAELGEHPYWDARVNAFVWVDMVAGVLRSTRSDGVATTEDDPPTDYLGAVLPAADGRVVAVTRSGLAIWDGRILQPLATLAPDGVRLNDAAVDHRGRVWVGSTSRDRTARSGALLVWDPVGGMRLVCDGLGLPNGIGWSPDGRTLYLADSDRRALFRTDFDPRTAEIGALETVARWTDGVPDGICVDAGGDIWVAIWDGGRLERRDGDGQLLDSVALPVSRPTSCAIDPNGLMVVTTARHGLSPERLSRERDAGRLLLVSGLDVRPLPTRTVRL